MDLIAAFVPYTSHAGSEKWNMSVRICGLKRCVQEIAVAFGLVMQKLEFANTKPRLSVKISPPKLALPSPVIVFG